MASARSIGSGTITFGMVSIPFRQYTATRAQGIAFNMLHKGCGSRIEQQRVCPAHDPKPILQSEDLVKAFEHARDQYVEFTPDEIRSIEAARPSMLELLEFVPAETIDLLYIEKTYYLGPDKGGARGFRLLSEALRRADVVGVGTYANRGKDTLVLLRAYRGGLILHESYYTNEVLPYDDIPQGEPGEPLTRPELDAAKLLIETLEREKFAPERFRDEWAMKVKALVEEKLAGRDVVMAPPTPKPIIVDMVEALKRSILAAEERLKEVRAESKPEIKGPRKAKPRKTVETKTRAEKS